MTHAQTWASYSALYRFGSLSVIGLVRRINNSKVLEGLSILCGTDTGTVWGVTVSASTHAPMPGRSYHRSD